MWTLTFYGGSEKYSVLQNSVFVASETVASSDKPGYFLVGMKISKVWPRNTTVTIGDELRVELTEEELPRSSSQSFRLCICLFTNLFTWFT